MIPDRPLNALNVQIKQVGALIRSLEQQSGEPPEEAARRQAALDTLRRALDELHRAQAQLSGATTPPTPLPPDRHPEPARWLQTLFDHIPIALVVWEPPPRVALWNRAAETLFGWRAADVVGKPHGPWPEYPQAGDQPAGLPCAADTQRAAKDGSLKAVRLTQVPLLDPETGERCLMELYAPREETELTQTRLHLAQAREAEHSRLARDLHDFVVQHLVGLHYQMIQAQQGLATDPTAEGKLPHPLQQTFHTVDEGILAILNQLRAVIRELRPAGLEEFGLAVALEGCVSQLLHESTDAPPHVHLDLRLSGETLSQAMQSCLFRVAQETLRNVIHHARAQQVRVTLAQERDTIILEIEDDGIGFQQPQEVAALIANNQFGWIRVAERVRLLGGELVLHSAPGHGTQLKVMLPFEPLQ